MASLRVVGGQVLRGVVEVNGSKNGALAVLPAPLLCHGVVRLHRVPDIADVHTMLRIVQTLGVMTRFDGETVEMDTTHLFPRPLPNGSVTEIRASIYLAGCFWRGLGK
jgi:UDP-N-acetylglucosamine enolpyruvyl transferase